MPPEDPPGTPEEWLARAKSNLAKARYSENSNVFFEDLCFDAQQAAEKSIKAVLLEHNAEFRYVHIIEELITNCEENGIPFPDELKPSAGLTEYAVQTRYPGMAEKVTAEEYQQTLELAEKVYTWASNVIENHKGT